MNNIEVPDCGKIEFELDKDLGEYTVMVEGFLKHLITGIAKRSAKYHEATDGRDHLFAYSEKQLNTAVCPVIANIEPSCAFKMELSIKREGKPRRGNLDYWIIYNDIVIALELKLAHVSYSGNYYMVKKSVYEKYNKALEQLENIEKDDVPYLLKNSTKLIKIALEAVVFQKRSKNPINIERDELIQNQQDIQGKLNHLMMSKKFNEKINYYATWLLKHNLMSIEDVIYKKYRASPVLGFIGHVSDIKIRDS